ncbi:MAG TPA: VirB3 family type IV secretion system protein [Rhodanobacteraceae bacterium]
MRASLDCSGLSRPRQIAGIDFKLVMMTMVSFGFAAISYKTPSLMVLPIGLLWLIHGPAKRDPAFIKVYMKHRVQHDHYAPTYVVRPINFRSPRPAGFNRGMML